MSHLVLARKYRPKKFAQVVGQDSIVAILKAAMEKNRTAHAMLFTGGRGVGKTTIARLVAKALVCLQRIEGEPCGSCTQCVAIDNFSSLDVVEIDGASHTGVDDIRELRDSARYQPSSAKYKIFIIDEVHMLSMSAFNALLKILEEPPAHVLFIFATTEAHKIPKTILSRCQRYDFKRVSKETIFATLKNIAEVEGFSVEDAGLWLIAALADGALRDSLSILEQIISSEKSHYSAEYIAQTIGVVGHQVIVEMACGIVEADVDKALLLIKDVYEKGFDLCQLMDALVERFRLLSLCAHVNDATIKAIIPHLTEQDLIYAKQQNKADLKRLFGMAIDALPQVFHAQSPLFALELFILRAALRPPLGDAVSISNCLQKLDALMHNRPLPIEPLPVKPVVSLPATQTKPMEVNTAVKKTALELFTDVITGLTKTAPMLASHLRHARPLIHEQVFTLHFEHSLHYEQVVAQSEKGVLKDAINKGFGRDFELKFELIKTKQKNAVPTIAEADDLKEQQEQTALYEKARNHDLVKKALEIFGGDITEVKKILPSSSHDHHAE